MSYTTPPALSPQVQTQLAPLISAAASNANAIGKEILVKGLAASGVQSPKISIDALQPLIENRIIPYTHTWEGGYGEHPNDTGGATMRGVTISTFIAYYNKIFAESSVAAVASAAKAFTAANPGWNTPPAKGGSYTPLQKQVLYLLLQNPQVAKLFIYLFMAGGSFRYPIAVMCEDPILGFFYLDLCWATGPGCYLPGYVNLDGVMKQYGWNGNNTSWPIAVVNAGDKTPEIMAKSLSNRVSHINRLSQKPGQDVFRQGWFNRLLNGKNSQLMMLVAINEEFCLNKTGIYKFTSAESAHLLRKGKIYESLSIDIPT